LQKSDAPVAHDEAPPAIASRIEKALKRKAKGQLGGKSAGGGRAKRPAVGGKAKHAGRTAVGRPTRGRKTSSHR